MHPAEYKADQIITEGRLVHLGVAHDPSMARCDLEITYTCTGFDISILLRQKNPGKSYTSKRVLYQHTTFIYTI